MTLSPEQIAGHDALVRAVRECDGCRQCAAAARLAEVAGSALPYHQGEALACRKWLAFPHDCAVTPRVQPPQEGASWPDCAASRTEYSARNTSRHE